MDMHTLFALAALLVSQAAPDHALSSKDLPIFPIDKKEFVYGNNLDFDVISSDHGVFDPKQLMPKVTSSQNGGLLLSWINTPADLETTDRIILSVVEPGTTEPIYHRLEVIEYGKTMPRGFVAREFLLLYDYHVFCIAEGDADNDPPEFHCGYNLLLKDHILTIDVGQYKSGTGAFNSHAIFEISATGPKLISLGKGGRIGK